MVHSSSINGRIVCFPSIAEMHTRIDTKINNSDIHVIQVFKRNMLQMG
jgi:hypothetical protein